MLHIENDYVLTVTKAFPTCELKSPNKTLEAKLQSCMKQNNTN